MNHGSKKHSIGITVALCTLLLSSCASFSKESVTNLAKTGQSSMDSLARYYSETLEVVQLNARENMLRQALEVEAGICKQHPTSTACETDRTKLTQSYQSRSSDKLALEEALRAREKMARSAEQLYVTYGRMASDTFESDVKQASSSMLASLDTVSNSPAQGAAISETLAALANGYELNQLKRSESMLQKVAEAIRDQFSAEASVWKTQYEGYFIDYRQNTVALFNGDYATKSDLGSDVLATRGLKQGSQHLNANPSTMSLLAEYRAEDATKSKRLAMKAGDQAQTALNALVEAHADTKDSSALGAAINGATRLAAIVDAIAEQESKPTKAKTEGEK